MTLPELKWRINLILSQCRTAQLYVTSSTARTVSGPEAPGTGRPTVVLPGQSHLVNEQIPLLRVLYSQCSKDQQATFGDLLLSRLSASTGSVIAHVLADTHRFPHVKGEPAVLQELFSGWRQRLVHAAEHFSEGELEALLDAVRECWGNFPKKQNERGTSVIQTGDPHYRGLSQILWGIGPLITLIRYERLKAQLLERQNPEINTDKQVLVSRSATLGFPPELGQVLEEIDVSLAAASSPFDFKACIGHIRTVLEKVFEHSARVASNLSGKPLSANAIGGKFNETKNHLLSEGLLSAKEAEAIQGLYNYISTDGAHAFGSAPEQARVAKNNVIEWSLLVVGRVQQYVDAAPRS